MAMDMTGNSGAVELAVGGIAGQRRGQVGVRGDDGRLHVARRAVDVAVDAEGQLNVRRADAAGRRHVVDVGDGAEMPLQRRRDGARHDLGTGARQLCADTKIAGTSMRGSGATGSSMNATPPHSATPTVNRVVATGPPDEGRGDVHVEPSANGVVGQAVGRMAAHPRSDAVERQIDDRCREQRQHLAHQQAADDADARADGAARSRCRCRTSAAARRRWRPPSS